MQRSMQIKAHPEQTKEARVGDPVLHQSLSNWDASDPIHTQKVEDRQTTMKVTINDKGEWSITGKVGEDGGPYASASGKSVLLASSGGTKEIEGVMFKTAHNGPQPVSINLNLTIPHPDAPPKKEKENKAPKTKVAV